MSSNRREHEDKLRERAPDLMRIGEEIVSLYLDRGDHHPEDRAADVQLVTGILERIRAKALAEGREQERKRCERVCEDAAQDYSRMARRFSDEGMETTARAYRDTAEGCEECALIIRNPEGDTTPPTQQEDDADDRSD